jgi:hypothetical protein
MVSGCKHSKKHPSRPKPARVDREPGAPTKTAWLRRVAVKFCSAITMQVPVGFEDETGFHSGVLWTQGNPLQTSDPKTMRTPKF